MLRRDRSSRRGSRCRQAGEKAHFDDAALLRVQLTEAVECTIEGDYVHVDFFREIQSFLEGELAGVGSAALRSAVGASVLHQNLTHHVGGYAEEMSAILPFRRILPGEPQESLVHQGSALQGVVVAFALQIVMGQAPQLGVNQRHQRV